jgi:TonB family protein
MDRVVLPLLIALLTAHSLCAAPTRISQFASRQGTPIVVYEYEKSDRRLAWGGYPAPRSGVILWEVDPASGKPLSVRMQQETGDSRLDAVALQIAREWRFKPGSVSKVRAPIVFTKRGIRIG